MAPTNSFKMNAMTCYHLPTAVLLLALLLLLNVDTSVAQQAVISEQQRSIETYPFGDPNPVPFLASNDTQIYPYFSFDRYSHESTSKEWKVVHLENKYIKLFILPEVGGKVWGAVEKSTNNEFIYLNEVLKFRNIALRGPWTSGGIEFNVGVTGHTPSTATPVDYRILKNDDGSVSCIVGGLNLLSRTRWRVTITLPKDKAYFKTESFWYNPTPLDQPYFVWLNAAVKAATDLQFFFPGTHYVNHQGDVHPWPVNEQGKNLSYYKNNDFGSSKSYHILGKKAEFYGGYWHGKDFGFGNWSLYSDTPGKKLWIWSLARSGAIWEDLLTDTDGQYVEVQSGRLFSQAQNRSITTPFDYAAFNPSVADQWNEIWFPVKETGGISAASPYGVLHLTQNEGNTVVKLMALQRIQDELKIFHEKHLISNKSLSLKPLEIYSDTLGAWLSSGKDLRIKLGNNKLTYSNSDEAGSFDRPLKREISIAEKTASKLYQYGINQLKTRNYTNAFETFYNVLEIDSAYINAYVGLANLYYRREDYSKALNNSRKALSFNTYHSGANFIHGIINSRLGESEKALEALGWAARSPQYRSAAYVHMAELYLKAKRFERAIKFANRALNFNQTNIKAYKILAICYRKQHKTAQAQSILNQILEVDPLNHFSRFEQYLLKKSKNKLNKFNLLIRNELPHETYLELAIFYANTGSNTEAIKLLKQAPPNPMVYYWLAYLQKNRSKIDSRKYLSRALSESPYLIFPFRTESIAVLKWAQQQKASWKNNYYLGLIYWHIDRVKDAVVLFDQLKGNPDYAPFYLTRGKLRDELNKSNRLIQNDYQKAKQMNPDGWRSWHALTDYYLKNEDIERALNNAERAYDKFPNQDAIEMDYANSLLANGKFKRCISLLDQMQILPFEGASASHSIYEYANIFYALKKINEREFEEAFHYLAKSKSWPENLGVGKPYHPDNRIQNYLEAFIYQKKGEEKKAGKLLNKVADFTLSNTTKWGVNHYIGALALRSVGKGDQAQSLMSDWQNARSENPLVQWSIAHFNGDSEKVRQLEARLNGQKITDKLLLEVINSTKTF